MDTIAHNHKSISITYMNTHTIVEPNRECDSLQACTHTHIHRLLMDSVNQVRTCISEHSIRFQETYVHLD